MNRNGHKLGLGKVGQLSAHGLKVEDLLYRVPVTIHQERVEDCLRARRVLVTGAGGSIGSELALQIAQIQPERLVLADHHEGSLFQIKNQLEGLPQALDLVARVLDIRAEDRIEALLRTQRPEYLFHAAAYKHLGMMEAQPVEAFLNNTFATLSLAEAAGKNGVVILRVKMYHLFAGQSVPP